MGYFSRKAAIVGIGQTEFSKDSGRSPQQLAAECSLAAIEDAGLTASDIDGMIAFTVEENEEVDLMGALGIPGLAWATRIGQGGGGSAGTVFHAAVAIASGAADTVLIYRAFNERSGRRFGRPQPVSSERNWNGTGYGNIVWGMPYGVMTPSATISLAALDYMNRYGVTNLDFGHYAVGIRQYAATQPTAWFRGRPITLEEHQASRWIIEPVVRLLDCCQESDGGVALVMTSLERARYLKQPPAVVVGGAQDVAYRGNPGFSARTAEVGRRLFKSAGLTPKDISAAYLYDAFTPEVFNQLEGLGFCGPGEAKDFLRSGATRLTGALPLNTNGGLQGEAYIHGMNMITEAVRQLRGTAANQVSDVEHLLVSSGSSAHILGRA